MKNLKSAALMLLVSSGIMAQSKDQNNGLSTVNFGNPTCHNVTNGWITVNTNPNAGPQSILWNTGETTMSINHLSEGTYIFTISDNAGNTITDSVVLVSPSPLEFTPIVSNPSSPLAQDGSITFSSLLPSGCSFNWTTNNGAGLDPNSFNQTHLAAGSYTFVIERNSSCSITKEFTLNSQTPGLIYNPGSTTNNPVNLVIKTKNVIGTSPFKGKVHVKLSEETQSMKIYNQNGQPVEIQDFSTENKSLQLISMEPGYYFAVFQNENGTSESKSFKVE